MSLDLFKDSPPSSSRSLLEASAAYEPPVFPLPPSDRPPPIESFSQSAFGLFSIPSPPTVRFPWPGWVNDPNDMAAHLPVGLVEPMDDEDYGSDATGEDLYDLLSDAPMYLPSGSFDPSEHLIDLSDSDSTMDGTSEQPTDLPADEPINPSTSSLVAQAQSKILQLPGEIINMILSYLTEPADYEIKWLVRRSHLTCWQYRIPRSVLDTHTQHGTMRRIPTRRNPGRTFDWGPSNQWSDAFNSQWTTKAVTRENTIQRRSKFRAGYRRYRLGTGPVDPVTGTLTRLEYVSGDTSWIMVCRRFYEAAASQFYFNKTFSFASRSLFGAFLRNLTPNVRPWLRRIYLYHEPPGWPKWRRDVYIQDKENDRWIEVCAEAAKTLTGLELLEVYLYLKLLPPNLDLKSPWAQGLLQWEWVPTPKKFYLYIRAGPTYTDRTDRLLRLATLRVTRGVLGQDRYIAIMEKMRARGADIRDWQEAELQFLKYAVVKYEGSWLPNFDGEIDLTEDYVESEDESEGEGEGEGGRQNDGADGNETVRGDHAREEVHV